jgi:putative intracellular protease/amidase
MTTNANKNIKPVLFVMTSNPVRGKAGTPTGFWLSELTHALAKIDDAKIPFELASIQGGTPPVDPDSLDVKDETNARYWNSPAFQEALSHTKRLADVDSSRYSAIFFAGGHGTMWDFPESEAVRRVTREIWEAGGVVSAVCHGPAALVNVRLSDGSYLVAGKRVAAFTDEEEAEVKATDIVPFLLASTLIARGALHQRAANWQANVAVDGRLVTGQNPSSAAGVGAGVRDVLLGATGARS